MTKQKATPEAVDTASQTLIEQGFEPTADKIVAMTGGSKSTVLKQLNSNATTQKAPPRALPEKIENMFRAAAHEILAHSCELADKNISLIREEADDAQSKIKDQLESERKNVQRLQKDLEDETIKSDGLRKQLAEQSFKSSQVDVLNKRIEELGIELKNEQARAQKHECIAAERGGALNALMSKGFGQIEPTAVS